MWERGAPVVSAPTQQRERGSGCGQREMTGGPGLLAGERERRGGALAGCRSWLA